MVAAVTSAFGDPTRREIYLFARASAPGVTASEVAERFSLHPNVARHHLDKLAAGGYLDVQVGRQEGAGAGRPSKRYQVPADAGDGVAELPGVRDDLVVRLLARVLAMVPKE
jgi:predicted ArsR family transcriptional regulator